MTNVPLISEYGGTVPNRANQTAIEFTNNIGIYLDYFNDNFTPDSRAATTAMNALGIDMNNLANTMAGFSNYTGDYDNGVTYAQGESVTGSDGLVYVCKIDGTIGFDPASDAYPAKWHQIQTGIQSVVQDNTPQLGGDLNGLTRTIYNTTIGTQTGFSLAVNQGNILRATFAGDNAITFTGIPAGSTDWLVEVDSGGFTITWPASVSWDGDGTEPAWSSGVDTAYFYTTDGGTTIKGMQVRAGSDV